MPYAGFVIYALMTITQENTWPVWEIVIDRAGDHNQEFIISQGDKSLASQRMSFDLMQRQREEGGSAAKYAD